MSVSHHESIVAFTNSTTWLEHQPARRAFDKHRTFSSKRHTPSARKPPTVFTMQHGSKDLLIVGAGMLGRMVGVAWRADHPHATVVAETRTPDKHAALASLGLQPALASPARAACGVTNFPYVLLCSTPSTSEDYAGLATETAARTALGGRVVFTSSAAVFANTDRVIDENAPLASDSPRAQRLLQAERAILSVQGGCVLRLSSLFTLERGPHKQLLLRSRLQLAKDGVINSLHYEDAASAVRRCLDAPDDIAAGKIFLIAGPPITREELCKAARLHPLYANRPMPEFVDSAHPVPRIYDCTASKLALQWEPRHKPFREFFEDESRRAHQAQTT